MKQLNGNDRTPEFDAFMKELVALCKKHKCSIGHEDGHGAFEICFSDDETDHDHEWIGDAAQLVFAPEKT